MRFARSIVPGAALLASAALGIASSIASAQTYVFGRARIAIKQARLRFSAIAVSLLAALLIGFGSVTVFSADALAQNPVPFINQPLVPDATAPGGPQFTLTLNGTGFVSGSMVNWNATALATQFISGSQLTATVPAADIAIAGTASVTVVNPAPGGGTSNVAFFTVAANTADSLAFYLASSPATGSVPEAVAVGDFNGDGKLDLAVANTCGSGPSCDSSGTVSILLGDGTGNFTLASSPAVGEHPVSVAVGDFDGDGKLDLAVANNGSNTVSILLGDGAGNFTLASSLDTGNNPSSVVVGDFNGDGKLDLAVGNGSIYILLGDGTGNFTLSSSLAGVGTPAVVGNFNGDGKLDLAVVSSGSKVSILLGDGTGNFTLASSPAVGNYPYALAVGDFNGDGKLDLAVTHGTYTSGGGYSSGGVSILLGDGTGHFSLASSPAVGKVPASVAVGDFNGDGKLDLAVADSYSNTVSVLLGDGTGNFTLTASPATGYYPESAAVGDFNGDGKLDLALPNLDNAVSILLQGPSATLSPTGLSFGPQLAFTTSGPQSVTLSNTGSTPLTITSIATSGDFAQTNTCGISVEFDASCTISVTFTPTSPRTRVGTITIADNAAGSRQIVDLTGTGLLSGPSATLAPTSLAFSNQPAHTTSIPQTVRLTNAGTTALSVTSIVASGDFAQTNTCGNSVAAGVSCPISVTFTPTHTGTRTGSVTVTDDASGSPQSVLLTGSNSTLAQNPVPLINQPLVPDAAAPGGSQFTLTVNGTGFGPGSVVKWNGSTLPTQFIKGSQLTATVSAADVTTASTASVAVLNPAPAGGTSSFAFLPVTANEGNDVSFIASSLPPTGASPVDVAVGDFNGDGKLDLAVANGYSSSTVSIMLGDGTGNFIPISSATFGGFAITVDDFNGDGKQDLAVAVPGGVGILLGDGTGSFSLTSSVTVFGSNFPMTPVGVGDFNGDGNLDLAVPWQYQLQSGIYSGLSIFLGDGTGNFGYPPINIPYPATGPFTGPVVVGDFNGDGKLDLAVTGDSAISILLGDGTGNFTLTSSVALAGTSSIVVGDFNGDGKLDLAVADSYSNTVSVLLGDGTGNFTLFSSVAGVGSGAAAGDFNGDGKLDLAVCNSGSGTVSILLGDGTGNFTLTSSLAVSSYPPSVAVGDFDGDGKLDLALPGLVLLQPSPLGALSPTSINFAAQLVSTTGGPQTVTLTNPGSAALIITSIAANGDFAQTNTCGGVVDIRASCTISVTFTPTALGTRTGTLTVTDSAPGSPQIVSLTGTATGPAVTLSATTVSLGGQVLGTTSAAHTVTLTNTGNAVLNITSIGITPAALTETNTCEASLAAGASCTITVTFTPSVAGNIAGMLSITDNALGSPQQVTLSGTGQDFSIGPYNLTSSIPAGFTAAYDLAVSPQGGFNQTVSLACSGAPQQSSCTVTPTSTVLDGRTHAVITLRVLTSAPAGLPPMDHRLLRLPPGWLLAAVGSILWLLTMLATEARRRLAPRLRLRRVLTPAGALLLLALVWVGCGGGGSFVTSPPATGGTPSGTYMVTVTATSGHLSHAVTVHLTVR